MFLKSLNPFGRIRELVQELRRTREERDQARQRNGQLEQDNERLEKETQRLQEEIRRLRKELETAQRAGRRQAAPFSRGKPKTHRKPPGRKSGAAHGPHHQRPIPDHVDEEIDVSAPEQCPVCGGPLTVERVDSQYREEIVRRTWVRRFNIPVCRRTQCEQRVQGRHPLQTSDALGAAAVQVGPEAVTLGVLMNKSLGLPRADAFMGMSEPDKSPAASPTTCALPTPTSTSRPPSSPSAGLPSLGSRRAIFHRPPQPIFDAPGADNSKRRAKRILPNP